MIQRIFSLLILILFGIQNTNAQVVYTEPVFPRESNEVTVFYDASKGTGGLLDCGCDIYIHSGVITNESTSASDWKHVNMTWGVANDAWKLEPVAGTPNLYSYVIEPSIADFYGIDADEEVLEIAFVFRNGDGTIEGKGDGGMDIYYPVYPDDLPFSSILLSPESNSVVTALNQEINVRFATSEEAEITLSRDGSELTSLTGNLLDYNIFINEAGNHTINIEATTNGETLTGTFSYVVPIASNIAPLPVDAKVGINIINDTEVTLVLRAPGKQNVFVFGTFSDYALSTDYQMNRTADGEYFWLNLTGLSPDVNYFYQYLIDGTDTYADPLSTLILDPQNDGAISEETFPNLPDYPEQMNGHVTWLQTAPEAYDWQVADFERPAQKELVIYELLVRDFIAARNYSTLIDTLDYLDRLGVNAIELMPVSEFENNDSWGYNPSYHKALDKYYGTPNEFKRFVDACHERGIAVILDVVYNQAFGQNPFVQMWFDGKPTEDNPYFNRDATHPFNVGFDMNHESPATREYVKNIIDHWMEEFRVDGFRFDLSKGFTQTNNPDNVGAWGNYDASRVAIWKDYADQCWATGGDDFYVILEHFAANDEEQELTAYGNGMMTWGNMNHNYSQASMGKSGNNIYGVTHFSRSFTEPRLIGYMESHDEERLMYNNLEEGASSAANDYYITALGTALRRQELVSTFFYPIQGPKMLWQFGELGYEVSINFNGRTGAKPIRWNYYEEEPRRRLYDVTRSLINLRMDYDVFNEGVAEYPNNSSVRKRIGIDGDDMDVVILGNFAVTPRDMTADFYSTGTWYEYFSGNEVNVDDVEMTFDFQPGEYRLYTSNPLSEPFGGYIDTSTEIESVFNADFAMNVSPNPSVGSATLSYTLTDTNDVHIELYDVTGRWLGVPFSGQVSAGEQRFEFTDLDAGQYIVRVRAGNGVQAVKLIVIE